MADNKPKMRIVDDPSIGCVYANEFVASAFDGGALVLTFGESRYLPPMVGGTPKQGDRPSVYVVERIALSPNAAIELVNNVTRMLDTMGVPRKAEERQQQPQKPH